MAGFRIQKEKLQGGVVLVGVKGFLDAHTFEQLEREFNDIFDAGSFRLIVDLSGLDYISSAGAGVFIEAIGTAQENEGNIVLIRPGPNVKEVFDLLGLSQIFIFKDSQDEALKSLARVGA